MWERAALWQIYILVSCATTNLLYILTYSHEINQEKAAYAFRQDISDRSGAIIFAKYNISTLLTRSELKFGP